VVIRGLFGLLITAVAMKTKEILYVLMPSKAAKMQYLVGILLVVREKFFSICAFDMILCILLTILTFYRVFKEL